MSQEIDNHIKELGRQHASKNEEFFLLESRSDALSDCPQYTPEVSAELKEIKQSLKVLREEIAQIAEEIRSYTDLKSKLYVRPTGGLHGIVNGLLPQLPEQSLIVQPTKDALEQIPNQRKQAVATLAVSMAAGITALILAPWTASSLLFGAVIFLEGRGFGRWVAAGIVGVITLGFFILHIRHRSQNKLAWNEHETRISDREYMAKTLRFSLGAEQWSGGVRLWTAAMYAISSVFFMPVCVIVSFAVFGYLLTRAYVIAYQESGSRDIAALTRTKLHRTTTDIGIPILVAVIAFYLISALLFLVTQSRHPAVEKPCFSRRGFSIVNYFRTYIEHHLLTLTGKAQPLYDPCLTSVKINLQSTTSLKYIKTVKMAVMYIIGNYHQILKKEQGNQQNKGELKPAEVETSEHTCINSFIDLTSHNISFTLLIYGATDVYRLISFMVRILH